MQNHPVMAFWVIQHIISTYINISICTTSKLDSIAYNLISAASEQDVSLHDADLIAWNRLRLICADLAARNLL